MFSVKTFFLDGSDFSTNYRKFWQVIARNRNRKNNAKSAILSHFLETKYLIDIWSHTFIKSFNNNIITVAGILNSSSFFSIIQTATESYFLETYQSIDSLGRHSSGGWRWQDVGLSSITAVLNQNFRCFRCCRQILIQIDGSMLAVSLCFQSLCSAKLTCCWQ